MVLVCEVLGVNVQIVDTHWQIIFSQLQIIQIGRFLINIMDSYHVIHQLHLV